MAFEPAVGDGILEESDHDQIPTLEDRWLERIPENSRR
jgi:hypothetical protein